MSEPTKNNPAAISRRDFLKLAGAGLLSIAARELEIENPNFVASSYILNEKAFSKELVGHDVIPTETNDATKIAITYNSGTTLKDVIADNVLPEYHDMLKKEVTEIRWIKNDKNQETAVLAFNGGGICVIGHDENENPFIFESSIDSPLIDMDVLDGHIIYLKTIDNSTGNEMKSYINYKSDTFFTINPPYHYQSNQFYRNKFDIGDRQTSVIVSEAILQHDNNQLFIVDTLQNHQVKVGKYDPEKYIFKPIIECESLDTIWNIKGNKPVPFIAGVSHKDVGIFTTLNKVPTDENKNEDQFFVITDGTNMISLTRVNNAREIQLGIANNLVEVDFVSDKNRVASIMNKHKQASVETDQLVILKIIVNGSIYEVPWIIINKVLTDVYTTKVLNIVSQFKDLFNNPYYNGINIGNPQSA